MAGLIKIVGIANGLMLMVFASVFAADPADWVALGGHVAKEKPAAEVIRMDDKEMVIEFTIKGFNVEDIVEEGKTYSNLRFPYYYTTLEVGKPQLPAITEMVGIPGDTGVEVEVVDHTIDVLQGYSVYPFQTPLLETQERTKFDLDKEAYSRNAFYPGVVAEIAEPAIWRDVRVVKLRVYPVQYNPVTETLNVYRKLTVKLRFAGKSDVNVLDPTRQTVTPGYEEMYRQNILNYDQMNLPVQVRSKSKDYDLLIIYVDAFATEANNLKIWKDSAGISTQIVPLSSITPPTANNIKTYIRNEYNNDSIKWVLLIGDISALPSYTGYTYWFGTILSDYWYALLSGSDLLPEVAVGRFSSLLNTEVGYMVDKTIDLENGPTAAWHDRVVLVAHHQGAPGKYQQCKEQIRAGSQTLSGTYRVKIPTFNTRYGFMGATDAQVVGDIDDGRLIVNYRGHGSSTAWSTWNTAGESFNAADVATINNSDKTPVVFSIACNNNRLDAAADCLGETFTKQQDAAVAFLGASRPSWTNPNHNYDKQLFATIFDEGTDHIGNASNAAAIRIMLWHGSSGEDNAKMYLWLGDPSLTLPIGQEDRVYRWLILLDTTGSMRSSNRMDRAKSWARQKVESILDDPNDEIALARFGGATDFQVLNNWTRNETALKNSINGLSPNGMTPLADACCAAADKIIADADPVSRRLIILTDGNENWSDGVCNGPDDPAPNPPWNTDPNSWHGRVWNKMVGSMIVDVGFFGGIGGLKDDAKYGDPAVAVNKSDEEYFNDLSDSTDGTYSDFAHTCGNGILEPWEECDCGFPCYECDKFWFLPFECRDCECAEPYLVANVTNLSYGLSSISTGLPVYMMGGPGRQDGDFETLSGVPDMEGWVGVDRSACDAGSFGQAWASLQDIDPCVSNLTPQVAFVDDGVVVPGTGGFLCTTWCYGPGGYIVNPEGGLGGPDNHLWNEIWSPVIDWPGSQYEGAKLEFDVFSHEPLSANAPGVYVTWHVRTATESTDAGTAWSSWKDSGSVYHGGPYYYTVSEEISHLIEPGTQHVQIALGIQEVGWIWGYAGTDGTPGPYLDNVALQAYEVGGPKISGQELNMAQDGFPAIGEADLFDLQRNSIRFDMARNVAPPFDNANVPGDSLVFDVSVIRAGSQLASPPALHYVLRPNPLFDSYRTSGMPLAGVVLGDSTFTGQGDLVPDRFHFDLPDSGFFFPGDVIHYYIKAVDNLGGLTTLPGDTLGFGVFPGDPSHTLVQYPSSYIARGLPTLFSSEPGDQPPLLWWNDNGGRGLENEWLHALRCLDQVEGRDFDVYYTNDPTFGAGNGLGGRGTPDLLAGYDMIMYSSGDLDAFTISNGDYLFDPSQDVQVLDSWLQQGGKCLFLSGNDLIHDLNNSGTVTQAFEDTWINALYIDNDVRPLAGNWAAEVRADPQPPLNPVFNYATQWTVYSACNPRMRYPDAIEAEGGAVRIAEWLNPDCEAGMYPYAAGLLTQHPNDVNVITLPYDLGWVIEDVRCGGNQGPATNCSMRAQLLRDVLVFCGQATGDVTVDVPETASLKFGVQVSPNPFNPRLTVGYTMPSEGRLNIAIYNVRGELVTVLLDEVVERGRDTVVWDGTDSGGATVSSGVYFYIAKGAGKIERGKLALVR